MSKIPSMADIARAAGVSKNTVSLALRGSSQIPLKTRKRIALIAGRLGYRKNATVAMLMAELRRTKAPKFQAGLALLNANQDREAFRRHPTIPTYVEGCLRRGRELGYSLDEFWLHDPTLDGLRLNQILKARGLKGAIVIGLMRENRLPQRFLPTWNSFPAVVTGVQVRDPALSFAATDHHMLALRAFQKALALGYQCPALVLDEVIDHLVDGRFSAGVATAQKDISAKRRVPSFIYRGDDLQSKARFLQWFDRVKPDLILTLYNVIRYWLEERGVRIPGDLGMIQLEWRADSPDWAGMNQHNDVVGEAALEMVVGMIHNRAPGVPEFPRATLVGSTWVDGETVRER